MNKVTRMLAITGMALAAGATIGAGPASAATSTASTASSASTASAGFASHQGADRRVQSHSRVVGYFRGPISCNKAGRIGEWRDRWDDYTCYRVRWGFKRGWWALSVSQDGNGHHGGGNHGGGFPGGGNHDGGFPGGGNHDGGFPGGGHGPRR